MKLYDNSRTVQNENQILIDFQHKSKKSYEQNHHITDVQYDSHRRSTLDLFPSKFATDTTLIFIHGGYWQWCDKTDFAFIAESVLKENIQCVLLEYDLAPHSNMSQIALQIRKAFDFIQQQSWITTKVMVIGHSAGAHLAAINLDHSLIDSAVLLSGIYDLEPIQSTHLNQALNLSEQEIKKLSPINTSTPFHKPYQIVYGSNELDELQWQSQHFFKFRQQLEPQFAEVIAFSNTDHYSILERYFKKEFGS